MYFSFSECVVLVVSRGCAIHAFSKLVVSPLSQPCYVCPCVDLQAAFEPFYFYIAQFTHLSSFFLFSYPFEMS